MALGSPLLISSAEAENCGEEEKEEKDEEEMSGPEQQSHGVSTRTKCVCVND